MGIIMEKKVSKKSGRIFATLRTWGILKLGVSASVRQGYNHPATNNKINEASEIHLKPHFIGRHD